MLPDNPPQVSHSWVDYLPAVLTQPETIFVMIVAFATYGYLKSFPKTDQAPWIAQVVTMAIAILIAIGLKVGNSIVYSTGTGIICGWGASSFYDLGFFWATNKIRALLGRDNSPSSQ